MRRLTINDNEIHVWVTNLKISEPLHKYFRHSFLPEEELIKADSFKFDQHRSYFIASHGYLRLILSQYLSYSPNIIEYGIGKYGKPFLENQKTSRNMQFNMSHSQEMAIYAVTLNTEIGIDIEKIDIQMDIEGIIQDILTPQEIKIFRNIREENKRRFFYDIWTRKEAILKSTGEGLYFPLNKLKVFTYENGSIKFLNIINHQHLVIGSYSLNCIPNYAAAIASIRRDNILCYLDVSDITPC